MVGMLKLRHLLRTGTLGEKHKTGQETEKVINKNHFKGLNYFRSNMRIFVYLSNEIETT